METDSAILTLAQTIHSDLKIQIKNPVDQLAVIQIVNTLITLELSQQHG